MAATPWEQLLAAVAVATYWTGEATVLPLAGEVTVTLPFEAVTLTFTTLV
jgi:hypothetical protein